jgi:hypothetical protein
MSSSSEIKVPLEDFHRHFVSTRMKGDSAAIFDELKKREIRSRRPYVALLAEWIKYNFEVDAYQDDNWYATEIPLDKCYFASADFRGLPVPKNERFVDFLSNQHRQEIDSGSFPSSSEIRAPWSGPMPEPLAKEREPGKYYISDGQLRVIRHWYHNVPTVKVFLYKGQCVF